MKRFLVASMLVMLAPACSSIIEGTTQDLSFGTTPQGALCTLHRDGRVIGQVTTPGAVKVEKTKLDILVRCEKEGYRTAEMTVESDVAAMTFGNIILGGGIGVVIDAASGASNKYSPSSHLILEREEAASTGPAAL
ncbi:hypothetical protein HEQ60_07020 [Haematospirillum sp. H1815]|uniref:hypothetical protein n=1 Tax=Haematospirillum sp. H1815 TaxID=2723108 RepID=UPI00143959BD|nr:hypothetical protein [Haematospirillum sp. H1815]NKD77510.1 hypothetical protein [Haematospirillum sp. H1815]